MSKRLQAMLSLLASLELALRRKLPLATRDEQLAVAATCAGAILLPAR